MDVEKYGNWDQMRNGIWCTGNEEWKIQLLVKESLDLKGLDLSDI